jgi:hypothetical protein
MREVLSNFEDFQKRKKAAALSYLRREEIRQRRNYRDRVFLKIARTIFQSRPVKKWSEVRKIP